MGNYEPLAFKAIKGRRQIVLASGAPFAVLSRVDYIEFLREAGIIEDEVGLVRRGQLVLDVQQSWHNRGQSGCRFAQVLTHNVRDGWATVVIGAEEEGVFTDHTWRNMADALRRVLRSDALAMSFIFPAVNDAEGLGALLVGLAKQEGWSANRVGVEVAGMSRPLSNIMVRYALEGGQVESWVLGFGPLECLPNTRQAPFVEMALMLRRKRLPLRHEKLNADVSTAHLADIPAERLNDDTYKRMFENTLKWKRQILEGIDDPRARARVTFTLPTTVVRDIEEWEGGAEVSDEAEAELPE